MSIPLSKQGKFAFQVGKIVLFFSMFMWVPSPFLLTTIVYVPIPFQQAFTLTSHLCNKYIKITKKKKKVHVAKHSRNYKF